MWRRDARIGPRAEERTHTHGLAADDGQFGKSVAVVVVTRTVAALAEDADARAAAFGDDRSIEHRVVVVGVAASERGQRMRQLGRTARRLTGDDVDRAADGRRAVERRPAAAQHLDPLDHGDGQLFKAVDRCQRTEDRAAVEQYLRILPFESVYAQLGRTAVAAVGFDAQSRLEIHRLGQIARGGRFEEFGRGHRYDSR
mgnify:CR=1 FL=1